MTKTRIEWADEVWNPVLGCTKVSPGCANCYAERLFKRFWKNQRFTDVKMIRSRMDDPLHWKKPRRVFVNSMSDLFHPKVDGDFIADIFRVMERTPQHTYMILTKRPKIMWEWFDKFNAEKPLPNVWLGVSAETQREADERIPILLQTPAAIRFVSVEPMLGPVMLYGWDGHYSRLYLDPDFKGERAKRGPLDWVICGGESGPGARPMHPDWARSLRHQCQAASVPFFFKQWGEWENFIQGEDRLIQPYTQVIHWEFPNVAMRTGKKAAGRMLDGREWNEVPIV